jgi:predicted secreted protein
MATIGKVNGSGLLIYVNGGAISFSSSCSVSFTSSVIDVSSKDSGGYKEIKGSGQKSFSLSTNAMFAFEASRGISYLEDLWQSGANISVAFTTNVDGDKQWYGSGKITNINAQGGTEDSASFSVDIEGNGQAQELTLNHVDAPSLLGAFVNASKQNEIIIEFDRNMVPTVAGWNFDGSSAIVINSIRGSGTRFLLFQLSRNIAQGESVNVDYNATTGNTLDDSTPANELATFSNITVTNNL